MADSSLRSGFKIKLFPAKLRKEGYFLVMAGGNVQKRFIFAALFG